MAALLSLGQQGSGAASDDKGLSALQQAINLIPQVMAALPDPQDVHDVATCLRVLTGVQKRLMGAGPQGGSQSGPAAQGY